MLIKNFKTLQLEKVQENILVVRLNRPEVRNAINSVMMEELLELWQGVAAEHNKIRCLILTGVPPAFCAGADLKERSNLSLDIWRKQHVPLEESMLAMVECPMPIISAVNGAAFGGGLELVLSSDFAYAANTAMFAQSEVKVGLMAGALGTQQLPKACGIKRAKELAFTGMSFTAEQACEWGIVNKVCAADKLWDEVLAVAKVISENAPLAVRQTKKAMNMSQELDIRSGYLYELEAYYRLLPTKDREEGIKAFNEKRKADYVGE